MAKKIVLLLFLSIILVGCNSDDISQNNTGNEQGKTTKEESNDTIQNKKEYDIGEVVIVETYDNLDKDTPMPEESEQYHINSEKFEKAILEHILEENNISYEYKEMPVYDDALTALTNGDADTMIPSADQSKLRGDDRFSNVYSHLKAIFTLGSGEITIDFDYNASFAILETNENFAKMINDGISKMKNNSKYKEIYDQYFDNDKYSVLN